MMGAEAFGGSFASLERSFASLRTSCTRSRTQPGFTLLEILVVVLIVGIVATFAVIGIGGRSIDDRLDIEARRLNELLAFAAEEAVLQGAEYGLRVTTAGYEFVRLNPADGMWTPFDDGVLRPRDLDEPFYLELSVDGRRAAPADPEAIDPPPVPQVLLLSSGEVTAFSLTVRARSHPSWFTLDGDVLGRLKLERQPS